MLALCLVAAIMAGGCTADSSPSPDPDDESDDALATGEPMDLDVLVYNIEYGGDASTDKVMRSLDADIVGVLESYNRLPEIAEKTGYPYYNVGLQLLSKYPIHEPSGAGGLYALIEVQPGYVVAFFNTHLDYVAYGPKLLAEGMSVQDVVASENEVRTSSMEILLPHLAAVSAAGYPTFLTGDFNQPSSLDYTAETIGTRDGVDEVVPWPVSEALLGIDFRDTFRVVHPDPVANPGLTHDNPDFRKGGGGDRIDYVYAGGPVETLDSQARRRDRRSERRHRVRAMDLRPPRRAVDVRARAGGVADHGVAGPSHAHRRRPVHRVPQRGLASRSRRSRWFRQNGDASQTLTSQSSDEAAGKMSFDTAELQPGGYDIVLLDEAGEEIARNEFWVRSREADVQISTDRPTYGVGEPIDVSWKDGPANRWDWVGVYQRRRRGPAQGRLPPLGLHRWSRLRRPPAVGQWVDDPRRLVPRASVAAAPGRLRRALPADGPVRVGGERRVQRLLSA